MLEDYLHKIEKLTTEQLEGLAERYRKTIEDLKRRRDEARVVALQPVTEYKTSELKKKQAELEVIEGLLESRR